MVCVLFSSASANSVICVASLVEQLKGHTRSHAKTIIKRKLMGIVSMNLFEDNEESVEEQGKKFL